MRVKSLKIYQLPQNIILLTYNELIKSRRTQIANNPDTGYGFLVWYIQVTYFGRNFTLGDTMVNLL